MTLQFYLRQTPADSGEAMFYLKTALKLNGWTVPSSSDGITYFATSDGITHSGTGAGGIKNAKAYFVARQPHIASGPYASPPDGTGHREWLFQRDPANGDTGWRVKVTRNCRFADGTIQAVAGNLLVNHTDTFSIFDGSTTKIYEFVSSGSPTAGHVAVPFSTLDSAGTVAGSIAAAVTIGGQNLVAGQSRPNQTTKISVYKTPAAGSITITENVANGGFSASAAGALVTPGASGEGLICGGGTDAAPTSTTLFPAAGTYRWNVELDDAAPYGFCAFAWIVGGSTSATNILYDPMADGTFSAWDGLIGDTDPYVYFASYNTVGGLGVPWAATNGSIGALGCTQAFSSGRGGPQCYHSVGSAAERFDVVGVSVPGTSAISPLCADETNTNAHPCGQNPFNNKDILLRVPWIRPTSLAAPSGKKGYSTYVKVNLSAIRSSGLVFTDQNPNDYVSVGSCGLRWDGGAALQ